MNFIFGKSKRGLYVCVMEQKERKSNAGRKLLPQSERKVGITIWVKYKHHKKAKAECEKIQSKYEKVA